jgi:hypothetical protein
MSRKGTAWRTVDTFHPHRCDRCGTSMLPHFGTWRSYAIRACTGCIEHTALPLWGTNVRNDFARPFLRWLRIVIDGWVRHDAAKMAQMGLLEVMSG